LWTAAVCHTKSCDERGKTCQGLHQWPRLKDIFGHASLTIAMPGGARNIRDGDAPVVIVVND
jgi:hypothetical protein